MSQSGSTFYIWTAGCQMNDGDSLRLAEELSARGFRQVDTPDDATVVVLNTCVVRQSAENRAYGRLNSLKPLKRRHPDMLIAVMGCLVGVSGDEAGLAARYPFVDMWLPPSRFEALLERLDTQATANAMGCAPASPLSPASPVARYVTIMTGCNNFCSYCIVPYRRGRERSRPVHEVLGECQRVARLGAREVTLLGQNVDSYGADLPGQPSLAALLRTVHEIEALRRIRFLTNHPKDMSQELIETVANLPKVCEHIELPLQSGNDEILRRMNRHYTAEQYLDLIQRIRHSLPGVALATDVIVGFPGENEQQFLDTYRLLEQVRFDAVHVACYSPRPGTAAAQLADDVPAEEKERRRQLIERLQERVVGEINRALVGKEVEVLFEDQVRGKWRGRTRTNKLTFVNSDIPLAGRLAMVKVEWAGPWSMRGQVVAADAPAFR